MSDSERQRQYYESRFAAKGQANEKAANWITNRWTSIRRSIQTFERQSGIKERILALHYKWLADLSDDVVLDLGCFSGNVLSEYLAQNARSYIGVDLSESAIGKLGEKLKNVPTAKVMATDFLEAEFESNSFDVVYAHSVLHHFADFEQLCAELHRIIKPGGKLVALDPTQTEPINWLARAAYRPFQSDKDWEWPFSRKNYKILGKYFEFEAIQGYRGFSKLGLLVPPIRGLTRWGVRMDERYATRLGWQLYTCWLVTLHLKKPASDRLDAMATGALRH